MVAEAGGADDEIEVADRSPQMPQSAPLFAERFTDLLVNSVSFWVVRSIP